MKAVVIHGAGDLRVDSVTAPVPEPDEAVIAVAYGGVCGSDLHYWRHGAVGESILRTPMVLGHEVSGTVVRAAADGSGPALGTPVTVHPGTPGRGLIRYPSGRPNLSGGTYLGSAATFPHQDGAFAAQIALPTRMLRPLPADLDLRIAALVEPASVAWHGVSRIGDVRGASALVVGCGPIGLLTIAVLRARGAAEITAVDLHEKPLELAVQLGATAVLREPGAEVSDRIDADIAVESSGHHSGLETAIRGVTRGGAVVMLGLLPSGPQPVPIALAITRELDLIGSFRFNDEIDEVIDALDGGSLSIDPVISHTFPAADAVAAFTVAADPTQSSKVLLDFTVT